MTEKKLRLFSEVVKIQGYSMVELIIVIVFVAIALVAVLNTFNVGITTSVDSEHLSLAAQLAEFKMEKIKSDKAAHGYDYVDESNYPDETNPESFNDYTRTVSITTYSDHKEVTVTVLKNDVEQITLNAIFANY